MTSKWFPICVAVAAILFSALDIGYQYDRLPPQVASHFDAHGNPDGQSTKLKFVGVLAATLALVVAALSPITLLAHFAPRSLINLPHKEYWLSPDREADTRRYLFQWGLWFTAATLWLLALLFHEVIVANLRQPPKVQSFWWLLGGYVAAVLGLLVQVLGRFRHTPLTKDRVTKSGTLISIACASSILLAPPTASHSAELHVAVSGNDANPGTQAAPLCTIQRAAERAQPGDTITVHDGVYRERINPPRGGESEEKRIVYQAAPGEKVEIKGSEVVKNWVKVQDGVWKTTLPNTFFGDFNPYSDLIRGDWFEPHDRQHHSGAVYINDDWLNEASKLEDVLQPVGTEPLWFAQVDKDSTTIWAQFTGVDPNEQSVEINVRRTVFYPDQTGMNYITVRGFRLRHAATPWAPPTAEQVGLVGVNWSKGWIIENNVISHSKCSGIALGKYGDEWDNTSANTAEGYVKTIRRALDHGWNKDSIGHHIVRHNTISHCEQAGIVGSLCAAFSDVSDNVIHDIHVRRLFSGAEMAGIKFHGAIDTTIRHNHIHRTCRGIWLDWMAQGARVSGNLLHDNASEDLFLEVNHGPFLIDNNLLLSAISLLDMSEGGAYVHNLLAGKIINRPELGRSTPYHLPHSTRIAGMRNIRGGDNRFYNNILVGGGTSPGPSTLTSDARQPGDGFGLCVYDASADLLLTDGNVYYCGAQPYHDEWNAVVDAMDPQLKIVRDGEHVDLHLTLGPAARKAGSSLVTTQRLGKADVPGLGYENPDGAPLTIDSDYFGNRRSVAKPTPGPFEIPSIEPLTLNVW